MREMKKDLKLYQLDEASKHITHSPRNVYVLVPLQKDDKESAVCLMLAFLLGGGAISWCNKKQYCCIYGKLTYQVRPS